MANNGYPTTKLADLTKPTDFTAGTLPFAAPANTVLSPLTTYAVVLSVIGNEKVRYDGTDSPAGDSGYAKFWSIANNHEWKNGGNWQDSGGRALSIVVRGDRVDTGNDEPVFNPTTYTRYIAENVKPGRTVDPPVRATNSGNLLTYTLSGPDAASFDIYPHVGSDNGRIKTKFTPDYEAKPSYTVTVTASDGGASASATLTVRVIDVDEPPAWISVAPILAPIPGMTNSLKVSWTAPDNTGKPEITSYTVRYRPTNVNRWRTRQVTGPDLTTTPTGLRADFRYIAQVQASNDEGSSGWSRRSALVLAP